MPGCYWVGTPSHGGLMLHRSQFGRLTPAALRYGDRFGEWVCYEEDCGYAIPAWEIFEVRNKLNEYAAKSPVDDCNDLYLVLSHHSHRYLFEAGFTPDPEIVKQTLAREEELRGWQRENRERQATWDREHGRG